MEEFLARLALFTALPVLLGALIVIFDRTATGPVRRAEAFLIPLFIVGVGGSGVVDFIGNVFISDTVARSLGLEPGNPFQLEVGFANLAFGLLGAVAAERRDGFREATVAAAFVFGVGATLVHVAATGSLGLGSLLTDICNLVRPALLIWFLIALRRAERAEPQTIVLRSWMIPVRRGSVAAVGIAATAFSVSYSMGQMAALSLVGTAVAAMVFWWIVSRAPSHRVAAEEHQE